MKKINENEFNNEVANGFALVDFFGAGCMNCKMLEPTLEKLEKEFSGIKFLKLDTAETPALNKKFGITSLPAVFLIKDGEVAGNFVGLKPQGVIVRLIKEIFGV
ncbi:MAG: thioredoxin family protein [Christensenellaceae bacterium]|jgi:thioredoxin 1|nr:thioredoxin family protein [Christensenellaceae bacterium]